MAEPVYRVLMFPHDAILHPLLSLLGQSMPVIWGATIASSFVWGAGLYVLWLLLQSAALRATRPALPGD